MFYSFISNYPRVIFYLGFMFMVLTFAGTSLDDVFKYRQDTREIEMQVVKDTLGLEGHERVSWLRYLSMTHDDEEARKWAQKEIELLDTLAISERDLRELRSGKDRIEKMLEDEEHGQGESSEDLTLKLREIIMQIEDKQLDIFILRQEAVLPEVLPEDGSVSFYVIHIDKRSDYVGSIDSVRVNLDNMEVPCNFVGPYCQLVVFSSEPPSQIVILPPSLMVDAGWFGSLYVKLYNDFIVPRSGAEEDTLGGQNIEYDCSTVDVTMTCRREDKFP